MARTAELETVSLEAKALSLRKRGKTYNDINSELGITNSQAVVRRAVNRDRDSVDTMLALETARLDDLFKYTYERLESDTDGGLWALDRLLKIMDRRAKYWGLDYSDKVAEARLRLEEDKVRLMATALMRVLQKVELPEDQREFVMRDLLRELRTEQSVEELI